MVSSAMCSWQVRCRQGAQGEWEQQAGDRGQERLQFRIKGWLAQNWADEVTGTMGHGWQGLQIGPSGQLEGPNKSLSG